MTYNFKAKFMKDEQFLSSESSTVTVNTVKGAVTLDLSVPSRVDIGSAYNIIVTCTDKHDKPISDLNVTVNIGDTTTKTGVTDNNGVATITNTATNNEQISITAKSSSNTYYTESNSVTKWLRTGKLPTTLTIDASANSIELNDSLAVSGYLIDETNAPAVNELVYIYDEFNNNKTTYWARTDDNGKFTYMFYNLGLGSHKFTLKYDGSNDYLESESNYRTVTVTKQTPIIYIDTSNRIRTQTVYAQLVNKNGAPLTNRSLSFSIPYTDSAGTSKTLTGTDTTDVNGVAGIQLPDDLVTGTVNVTVNFVGDSSLNSVSSSKYINIINYATVTGSPNSVAMGTPSGSPYRDWSTLSATGTSKTYALACSAGTLKAPRSLIYSFKLNVPDGAYITNLHAKFTDKTYGGISCAVPSDQVQFLNMGNGDSSAKTDNNRASSSGTSHQVGIGVGGLATVYGINNTLQLVLRWGVNDSGNCPSGNHLDIYNVSVICEYRPAQARPTSLMGA